MNYQEGESAIKNPFQYNVLITVGKLTKTSHGNVKGDMVDRVSFNQDLPPQENKLIVRQAGPSLH